MASPTRKPILRAEIPGGAQAWDQELADEAHHRHRDADARPDDHSGPHRRGREASQGRARDAGDERPMKGGQSRDELGGQARQQARDGDTPGCAAPQLADRSAQQARVGQRAQDVGHRVSRGKLELQAVDEDRRVEHAHADPEHADTAEVEPQLPAGRQRHPQPDHRLDEHAHAGQVGHRGGHGLDVVGAVFPLGAVAVGDDAAEDARQDLGADGESQAERHVGGGDPAQRTQDQQGHCAEQQVIAGAAGRRERATRRLLPHRGAAARARPSSTARRQ